MKIISLHSIKGGSGKSFLCQLFASYLNRHFKVTIVDLDASGPVLQFIRAAPQKTGITRQTEYNDTTKPFPYFYGQQVELLQQWSTRKRKTPHSPSTYQEFEEWFQAEVASATEKDLIEKLLSFGVPLRPSPASYGDRTEQIKAWDELTKEWKKETKPCVISGHPFGIPNAGKVSFVVLPHRPEFLRRLNQLTQSPGFTTWTLVTGWLRVLLRGLEDGSLTPDGDGTDVVLIDNSPGSSATANIMSLLRSGSQAGDVRNHAVCVVTTPRVADIVNSAYELTWLQAASGTKPHETQPVYWIGNMWPPDCSMEAILTNGLGWLFHSAMSDAHNTTYNAMRFAGLHSDDDQRISAVLKYAYLAGHIIPSTLTFTPGLRSLFDFSSAAARPAANALNAIFPLLQNWRLFSQLDLQPYRTTRK